MPKKQYTTQEAATILNGFLERALMASGLPWLTRGAWSKPDDEVKPSIPRIEADESGFVCGISHEYETAFGVSVYIRVSGSSILGGGEPCRSMEISWGSGGMDHPAAKILIHQKAIEAKTLYESMVDDFYSSVEIIDGEQEVAA